MAEPSAWGSIAPGRQIGKYQILQHMATGGMAEIYLARALGIQQFSKLVVIKRILPGHANNPEIRNMLLDEARIAATLHHPNIVQVFDIGETGGEYFYCMEYLHGRDVASIVNAARGKALALADDQVLSIALAMLAGLQYAHGKTDDHDRPLNIVHRDISPNNVFVTFDGSVKLLDFGLVKAEGRATESRSGALKGKLAYMSPEQCRARPCDRRADLFATAIVLWELTTGQRLFTGDCDFDFLTAILERPIPRPSTVVPDYPFELERIVMKGLCRDPDGRYPTAEAMQLELEDYARDHKLRISPITLRQMMEHLFEEDLASWHAAKRAGVALEDHIIDRIPLADGSRAGMVDSRLAPKPAPPITGSPMPAATLPALPRKRSVLPYLLGIGLLGAAGAAGYAVMRNASDDPPAATSSTPISTPPANGAGERKPTASDRQVAGSAGDKPTLPGAQPIEGSATEKPAPTGSAAAPDKPAPAEGSAPDKPAPAVARGPTEGSAVAPDKSAEGSAAASDKTAATAGSAATTDSNVAKQRPGKKPIVKTPPKPLPKPQPATGNPTDHDSLFPK